MHPWMLSLKNGLRSLTRHDPERALKYFNKAIKSCPVRETDELSAILHFTGVTLKKMGLHDGAIKSWVASWRIRKTPLTDRHIRRFSNEYGMMKQGLEELDDWKAFYALQLKRYCSMKKSQCVGTLAEQDMIRDLIRDAWMELRKNVNLSDRTPSEKLGIFRSVSIVFPLFFVPGERKIANSGGSASKPKTKTCFCGSDLPWGECCGRIFRQGTSRSGMF